VAIGRTVTDDDITTTLTGNIRVANGLDAFADPEVLAAIGGSPYANDLAAANLRPSDVVTFTLTADLPGEPVTVATGSVANSSGATDDTAALVWSVPLDGTTADLTTTSVLAQGSGGGIWGAIATIALIALVTWVVLALSFITFVVVARRHRARPRESVS
jgi:hypothetical protein